MHWPSGHRACGTFLTAMVVYACFGMGREGGTGREGGYTYCAVRTFVGALDTIVPLPTKKQPKKNKTKKAPTTLWLPLHCVDFRDSLGLSVFVWFVLCALLSSPSLLSACLLCVAFEQPLSRPVPVLERWSTLQRGACNAGVMASNHLNRVARVCLAAAMSFSSYTPPSTSTGAAAAPGVMYQYAVSWGGRVPPCVCQAG